MLRDYFKKRLKAYHSVYLLSMKMEAEDSLA